MPKPLAVAISDIHFNINNLSLAESALSQAIKKAEYLGVPLVIAGDLHDTKANIRVEVQNTILPLLKNTTINVYIIAGNHDLVNEKSNESGLRYLNELHNVTLIESYTRQLGPFLFIPYKHSKYDFTLALNHLDPSLIVFCHQGLSGALMGDYVQDLSAIDRDKLYINNKIFSGHYHKHQTIENWTYIGSPFTHTFGESEDGSKGYLIIYEDGSFKQEKLNFRRHVVIDINLNKLPYPITLDSQDLLWVKLRGTHSQLSNIDKKAISDEYLDGRFEYRLDLIPFDTKSHTLIPNVQNMNDFDILDKLIESLKDTSEQKLKLRSLYREILKSKS